MIGEIIDRVAFDDGYWDETIVFARYEVQRHVDSGYALDRYFESYDALGKRRIFAQLHGDDSVITIFASPEDGLVISRLPCTGGEN